MKSKHFRKDVIMARIIFGLLCIGLVTLLVLAGVWISKNLDETEKKDPNPGSQLSQNSEQESESESVSESESESESVSESESESQNEPKEIYGEITASSLNLRTEMNTSCEVIVGIPRGTKVLILEELGDWYKVSYDGKEGYLSAKYVKIIESVPTDDGNVTIE